MPKDQPFKDMRERRNVEFLLRCELCRRVIQKFTGEPTEHQRIKAFNEHRCVNENKQGFEGELRHGKRPD